MHLCQQSTKHYLLRICQLPKLISAHLHQCVLTLHWTIEMITLIGILLKTVTTVLLTCQPQSAGTLLSNLLQMMALQIANSEYENHPAFCSQIFFSTISYCFEDLIIIPKHGSHFLSIDSWNDPFISSRFYVSRRAFLQVSTKL